MATRRKDEYIPLDTSGNDYAGMVGMSDIDRAALDAAQQSWIDANAAGNQAAMNAAHSQAEAIRRKYSYSGGSDGSQYLPQSDSSFSYRDAPDYVNRYQSQIDNVTNQIMNREEFSYDPNTDPLYALYRDNYTRNGQRAMQDTLGQVAARTGGLASSYATSAANQTYNNYMAALADKIPELQQLAYSMYRDEGDDLYAQMNMLTALEQGDYAKYADQLAQYNADRNFAYGSYADDRNWDYQLDRDMIEDSRYDSETAYNQALDRAELLASMGDYSGYAALGLTDSQIAGLENAYQAAMQAASYTGGSSGGGTSGDEEEEASELEETLVQRMLAYGNDNLAQSFLLEQFDDGDDPRIDRIWDLYVQERDSGTVTEDDETLTASQEDKIARAASDYYEANPGVKLDSRTLDNWLSSNGYSGTAAQLFKSYLAEYGAGYSRG